MTIESIELKNYRNYEELHMELSQGTNILYGDNAQGKTNILEAVYVCCTTKSHRGAKDKDMIRFGEDESHIKLQIKKGVVPCRIDMHLKKNKTKGIAVDGIPIRKASQLFGLVNVVFFSPEDLNIIKNGPSERRRFIDMELCQLDKVYVHSLVQYNKVLLQRNKLLKEVVFHPEDRNPLYKRRTDFHPEYEATLDVWDEQLVRFGKEVIKARRDFIHQLGDIIKELHTKLSGGKENIEVIYDPDTEENELEAAVRKSRPQDMKQKTTLAGPHRDDISFVVNGIDIRRFGSQGQQRTAALSLKLSELELVKKISRDAPVLLLDDVLSELDSSRQNQLLDAIQDIQTMITCTGLEDFVNHRFHIDKIFKVEEGKVTSQN